MAQTRIVCWRKTRIDCHVFLIVDRSVEEIFHQGRERLITGAHVSTQRSSLVTKVQANQTNLSRMPRAVSNGVAASCKFSMCIN